MRALEQVLLANSLADWLSALGIALGIIAAFWILKQFMIRRLAAYARTTPTRVDDFVADNFAATRLLLLVPLTLYVAAQVHTLPVRTEVLIGQVAVIVLLLQSAIWGHQFSESWMRHTLWAKRAEDPASVSTVSMLGFLTRLGLWSFALLLVLDNLGFNITAPLTGLGIGGIAVALAAQNVLGDLLASISIVHDRPFEVGDFIAVNDHLGTVEYIGLKTTRVRSLSGEQIVFSNTGLHNSRIRNFKRMHGWRAPVAFGVVSQTPTGLRRFHSWHARASRHRRKRASTVRTSRSTATRRCFSRRCTSYSIPITTSTWTYTRRCCSISFVASATSRLPIRRAHSTSARLCLPRPATQE